MTGWVIKSDLIIPALFGDYCRRIGVKTGDPVPDVDEWWEREGKDELLKELRDEHDNEFLPMLNTQSFSEHLLNRILSGMLNASPDMSIGIFQERFKASFPEWADSLAALSEKPDHED